MTGLRSPLTGKRRRVETLVLGIRRQAEQTRLTLQSFVPQARPLPGLEVEVVCGDDRPPLLFVSDREGTVVLPGTVASDDPYVWLNVRSGQAWLARVPFVPGSRAAESLELPDDSPRLRAEGEIALLQAELVDTVARRAVLTATARARAKEKLWKETDAALAELRELPRADKYAADLNAIRVRYVRASREVKDRAAEARVVKLCNETSDLLKNYLDEDKIRAIREELDELRRIAAEEERAEKQFRAEDARRKK